METEFWPPRFFSLKNRLYFYFIRWNYYITLYLALFYQSYCNMSFLWPNDRCWVKFSTVLIYLSVSYFVDFGGGGGGGLPKHPFILRKSKFSVINTWIYRRFKSNGILLNNSNSGSKMADSSTSLFSNKWRHHDIIAIVKDHLLR